MRASILNISRVGLYSTRNGIAKRIAGRNFIEIGFNATVSRDSLVRWDVDG